MTPLLRTASVLAALTIGVVSPAAWAAPDDVALNGTFTAVSDGQYAKTNESFRNEATVTATWTITSSCTTFQDCTGTLTSDQGWTAQLVYASQRWRATRTIPNWEPCPDGTAAPGTQTFTFWAKRLDAPDRDDRLIGWDETVGPSGACGINRWLTIRMPLTVTRIG
ncbi:hypothetical protein Mycch_1922 [Mycolicibacterium chubuense NBB4]|uniref:Secreted protein n=1 Tax=Mycolicibacterium chubuense (strain NBB4) TaxID=710421 RepID=I4BHF0_MYCCN|nr:hypothetical protein [Mycolicibacterium chubuense]AFM16707.1 hypothetical protein Mycch_1922 [Mycolicibacterium chubuense NBB4]